MKINERSHAPLDRIRWSQRLSTVWSLVADLRPHDFRAALTFIQTANAKRPLLIRGWLFAGWTLRQMWVVLPRLRYQVKFAKPVATTPYWLASGNPLANHPWSKDSLARLPETVDTIVIGAGFTGASLAYFWSKHGKVNREMLVLEMGDPADGASGRNAGTVVMGRYYAMVQKSVLERLRKVRLDLTEDKRKQLADKFAAAYCRAAYRNADLLEQIIRREGFDCDYQRNGWIQVRTSEEQEMLNESVRWAHDSGFDDWAKLTPAKVLEKSGLQVGADAGFSQRAGTFHPAKWVWSLLGAAVKLSNVKLFTRTKVLRIEDQGDHYAVYTDRGVIQARYVVNATEAYTAALHRRFHDVIRPVQSQAAAGRGFPPRLPSDVTVSGALWFGDRRGNDLLFGTDSTPIPDSAANQNKPSRFLTKFALGELQACTGAFAIEVTHEWSGAVGFTADEYPVIGLMDAKRQYLIGGMCGSGTAVSLNAARCIVNRILEKTDEPDDYPPEYFAPSRLLDPAHHLWPIV